MLLLQQQIVAVNVWQLRLLPMLRTAQKDQVSEGLSAPLSWASLPLRLPSTPPHNNGRYGRGSSGGGALDGDKQAHDQGWFRPGGNSHSEQRLVQEFVTPRTS